MATFKYQDEEYELTDPDSYTTLEAIELQSYTGLSFTDILSDIRSLGATGIHCAVLISLRRAGLDVTWSSLSFPYLATVNSFRGKEVVTPPDPSMASTAKRKAEPRTRSASARSPKR